MFNELLAAPPYTIRQSEKEDKLLSGLNALTEHHYKHCQSYQNIIKGIWGDRTTYQCIEDIPYLPVSLFKLHQLQSVPDEEVSITLTSSGTTGQNVSKILVNKETSSRQQKALASSLKHVLGPKRLPMLIIDTADVFKNPAMMSARGAGVLGMMRYGRDHCFSLKSDLSPDFDAVDAFFEKIDGKPFFIFGFTFMVWLNFFEKFLGRGYDLSQGILIHSGGWKKMIEQSVDNFVFRQKFRDQYSLQKIYNFYGMVEQIGSIFLEGEDGFLYPPNFTDVIIRNPKTWEPCKLGEEGVIQVVSLIPESYPGHSLLTEDLGVIELINDGTDGRMGKALRILGRIKKAELRGCSDVIAASTPSNRD
ncbi:MAG: acyl-protein synthetase [Aliivibrio sp.]|uniref:LuxE/PaaK family acyltransferase n=1 Tax=Aliivibrio sp. TaxID=1872443 RepID=UPI001A4FB61D|nr:acyl-protein synthetase [Aliivibrio sp.]